MPAGQHAPDLQHVRVSQPIQKGVDVLQDLDAHIQGALQSLRLRNGLRGGCREGGGLRSPERACKSAQEGEPLAPRPRSKDHAQAYVRSKQGMATSWTVLCMEAHMSPLAQSQHAHAGPAGSFRLRGNAPSRTVLATVTWRAQMSMGRASIRTLVSNSALASSTWAGGVARREQRAAQPAQAPSWAVTPWPPAPAGSRPVDSLSLSRCCTYLFLAAIQLIEGLPQTLQGVCHAGLRRQPGVGGVRPRVRTWPPWALTGHCQPAPPPPCTTNSRRASTSKAFLITMLAALMTNGEPRTVAMMARWWPWSQLEALRAPGRLGGLGLARRRHRSLPSPRPISDCIFQSVHVHQICKLAWRVSRA